MRQNWRRLAVTMVIASLVLSICPDMATVFAAESGTEPSERETDEPPAELPVAWACTDDYEATDFDVFTGSGDGRMRAAEISGGGCKADIEP